MFKLNVTIVLVLICLVGCDFYSASNRTLEEKGDLEFSRRDYQEAIYLWEKALDKNPGEISVLKKLGEGYSKLSQFRKAKTYFEQVTDKAPYDIETYIKLIHINILIGEIPTAYQLFELIDNRNIFSPDFSIAKADLFFFTNQKEKAEYFYREAVDKSKDSIKAILKLSIFLKSCNRKDEASELFKIALKNRIEKPEIYMLISDYYLLDNDYENAEKSMSKAVALEPDDISLKYQMAQFYISIDRLLEAEKLLKDIIADIPNDIYLMMILSDLLIMKNDLDEAHSIIEDLKQTIEEPIAEFELLQGKFWLYRGNTAYAVSYFKNVIEMEPNLVKVRYLLGVAYLLNGNVKLGEQSLIQTLQIDPNYHEALLLISEIFYKRKEYDLSLGYIDRILESYPEDFSANTIKGLILLEKKEYAQAKKIFSKIIYLKDDNPVPYYYWGLTEDLLKNHSMALELYEKALEYAPDSIEIIFNYLMLLVKKDKLKKAEDFIQRNNSKWEKDPVWYYLSGKMAIEYGNEQDAISLLEKAVSLENVPGFIYTELASLYHNKKQVDAAIKTLYECIGINPEYEEGWTNLCFIYMEQENFSAALEEAQNSLKKIPESTTLEANLAWILIESGKDLNYALNLAQRAYEKEPNSIAVADTLGWAYYQKGIYSQAEWLLSEAWKKAPENGFICYHLGMTFLKQGKNKEAFKLFNKALESKESNILHGQITKILNEQKDAGKGI